MGSFKSKFIGKLLAYIMLILAILPHKLVWRGVGNDYNYMTGIKSQKIIHKQSVRPLKIRYSSTFQARLLNRRRK